MDRQSPDGDTILGTHFCTVNFHVGEGIIPLGASPWGERRIGYVTGGDFHGERLRGEVLPGGGNWSVAGRIAAGAIGSFDARAIWRTDDGALVYVTYTGRTLVPDEVRAAFSDPDPVVRDVDPAEYYIRVAMVFETASPQYDWLNGVLAIGRGRRTEQGARHELFLVA
ncbi:MAG: DUF3237 domain-containing protein [Tsuneonella sp.]